MEIPKIPSPSVHSYSVIEKMEHYLKIDNAGSVILSFHSKNNGIDSKPENFSLIIRSFKNVQYPNFVQTLLKTTNNYLFKFLASLSGAAN